MNNSKPTRHTGGLFTWLPVFLMTVCSMCNGFAGEVTIPSVSDGYGGSNVPIPNSTAGYGSGYDGDAGSAIRIPDTTAGYGSGVGNNAGTVHIPGAASGYGTGAIHMPGFPEGPGGGMSGPVHIPNQTSGYGGVSSGTVRIPTDTEGYGGGPSGTVRIPTETRGYGDGPSSSGTIRIPEQTTGYGESPSGTVVLPERTGGYGRSSGTFTLPGTTDGYGGPRTSPFDSGPAAPRAGPQHGDSDRYIVRDVSVVDINTGRTIRLGAVDLLPTLERIRRGEKAAHRNDGSVFQNRERNLPRKPRGYYREYVVPTPGVKGVGPQRLVVGDGGEVYYSRDHYDSFQRIE